MTAFGNAKNPFHNKAGKKDHSHKQVILAAT